MWRLNGSVFNCFYSPLKWRFLLRLLTLVFLRVLLPFFYLIILFFTLLYSHFAVSFSYSYFFISPDFVHFSYFFMLLKFSVYLQFSFHSHFNQSFPRWVTDQRTFLDSQHTAHWHPAGTRNESYDQRLLWKICNDSWWFWSSTACRLPPT